MDSFCGFKACMSPIVECDIIKKNVDVFRHTWLTYMTFVWITSYMCDSTPALTLGYYQWRSHPCGCCHLWGTALFGHTFWTHCFFIIHIVHSDFFPFFLFFSWVQLYADDTAFWAIFPTLQSTMLNTAHSSRSRINFSIRMSQNRLTV